jgi:hypothetical protein
MITEAPKGTNMSSAHQTRTAQGKPNPSGEKAKPTITFSGRADIDASELLKTKGVQDTLKKIERVRKSLAHPGKKHTPKG